MSKLHPEIKINSKAELYSAVKQIRCSIGMKEYTLLFRGQGNDCWELIPSIARKLKKPFDIQKLETDLIREFKEELLKNKLMEIISTSKNELESDWLFLQQAQHLKLPTRFMDWTSDLSTALFFAVAESENDKYDGHIWIYAVPSENIKSIDNNDHLEKSPFDYSESIFLNSSSLFSLKAQIEIATRRKSTQRGMFFIQPYEKTSIPLEKQNEHIPFLSKIVINSECKKQIRMELKDEGITKESLLVLEPLNPVDKLIHEDLLKKIDKIIDVLKNKYDLK